MDDALDKNETNEQTGEPNGQAGLPHAEPEQSEEKQDSPQEGQVSPSGDFDYDKKKRVPFAAMKVLLVILTISLFAFTSFGFGETKYTTRNWPQTILSGGGLLAKVFSGSYAVALRAAGETLHAHYESTKGNSAEAEKSYARALSAYETINAVNTVCGHYTLMGLGKAQTELKHDTDAQKTFERSLEAAKAVYGPEHESVAISLRELGFCMTKQKSYAQAEGFYKQALELDTKGLGADKFDVAYDMSCVGEMMLLQKNLPDAIKYLSDSIAIYKKARGEFHPSFLWVEESLGRAYYEAQKYKEAARQFENVLAGTDRIHGTPGKDYYRDLAWLGWSYFYDANAERARLRARKLKEMLAKKSDTESASMIDVLESNADLFMILEEYESAAAQFERVLSLQENKLGKKAPQLRGVLLYLGQCYEKLGKLEISKQAYDRASSLD